MKGTHAAAPDLVAFLAQQVHEHPRSGDGELHVQFVDSSHQQLIGFADRLRPVIRARSRDTDKPDLLLNRQCVATVDHRFALSNPALVSAPLKKSFSELSWPILACRGFTYTGGSSGVALAEPNTSAARSCSCRFGIFQLRPGWKLG